MVQRKLRLPEYFTESCDTPGIGFKCTVKVNQLCTCGYGQTKKDAKQNSAQKALELMGLIGKTDMPVSALSKVTPRPMPNVPHLNYVGKLNEYASTNGVPYPTYNDSVIPINGVFLTHCQFLNFITDGTGLKKKDAKQDASRKMLELLRTEDVTATLLAEKVKGVKIEDLNTLNQEILARYENFSTEKETVSKAVEIKAIPNLKSLAIYSKNTSDRIHPLSDFPSTHDGGMFSTITFGGLTMHAVSQYGGLNVLAELLLKDSKI
ncbi:hypothetical protein NQ318_004163 [Aromia moschata]|uniref:DRBM domain-containing protein n=1 Tax=Aromia moschata TaxID=1265417 RepID=A0AAV8XMI8_9CUCU|nr:hypothetical protein NQ318_004163 [Aromia moschata]